MESGVGGSWDRGMLCGEYEKIVEEMLKKSDKMTTHGVLFKMGVQNLGPFEQFKHLEFVKRGGGGNDSWDVYVRKVPLGAHEIPPSLNTQNFGVWNIRANLRALRGAGVPVPVLDTHSSRKPGHIRGKAVKAEVDFGVFPDIEGEVTPFRLIMETEVSNLDLKEMVVRLFDYMASWEHVAVCVGAKLYDWRDDRFVSLCVVLRRDFETGKPIFERIFNIGTRNADGKNGTKISELYSWVLEKVKDGEMTSKVKIQRTDTPAKTVEQLPDESYPLPEPRYLRTAIPDGLEAYYTVPVSAAELFYKCNLTDAQLDGVPPFSLNLYESRLKWNVLDTDWNTRKRRRVA